MSARTYGYTRVSTTEQFHSRLSIDEQQAQIKAFCAQHELDLGPDDSRLMEESASAYTLQFQERPVGRALNTTLQPGDHLVIVKVDRAFRDMNDALATVQAWNARGILIHLLDLPLCEHPIFGKLLLAVLAWAAEFESDRRGERMIEAWRSAKRSGKHMGRSHSPWGFRWVGSKKLRTARLEYCPEERAVMAVCWDLYREGIAVQAICGHLIRHRVAPLDRRPEWNRKTRYKPADVYHPRYVREMVYAEGELRYYEAQGLSPEEAAQQWLADWPRGLLPSRDQIIERLKLGEPTAC